MKWIKHPLVLKKPNRVHTKASLREERTVSKMFWPIWTPILVSFCLVDALATDFRHLPLFFGLRIFAAVVGYLGYNLSRGRLKHNLRAWMMPTLFALVVQYIMLTHGLTNSPYYGGLALVLFGGVTYFPRTFVWALSLSLAILSPTLLAIAINFVVDPYQSVIGLAMTLGTVLTASVFSDRVRKFWLESIVAEVQLREDLSEREIEVREKAAELVKRKRFESQFSPQVVARVLNNIHHYEKIDAENICTLVVDIKESSSKSDILKPNSYAEVIEEVFDIIGAACLKWDITLDKFTGDGAQAFAGSPEKKTDDLRRTVQACVEILKMLEARNDYLSMRWQGEVQLRFGICEGVALVGFLGKGFLRSFTAIGSNVSLAHRICAEAEPNSILVLCSQAQQDELSSSVYEKRTRKLTNLKGFESKVFSALELKPRFMEKQFQDIGRCDVCFTPLVLDESPTGLPKAVCPACSDGKQDKTIPSLKRVK